MCLLVCVNLLMCMNACVHLCVCVCLSVYECVCVCVCVYVHVCGKGVCVSVCLMCGGGILFAYIHTYVKE